MYESGLVILPFPYQLEGVRYGGALFLWPEECEICSHADCTKKIKIAEICSCAMGFNYIWITDDLLIGGFLLRNASNSSARVKRLRRHQDKVVDESSIQNILRKLSFYQKSVNGRIKNKIDSLVDEYKEKELYKQDFLKQIRPEIDRAFSSLHDYKQFVTQVIQNINVLIDDYPGNNFETKLDASKYQIRSVYWAARMMEKKLTTSLFLKYPDRIDDHQKYTFFSLHGLVLKFLRIYQMAFDKKNIRTHVFGESFGRLNGNADAIGVIPHTFIDNALKYAPSDSDVRIKFAETTTNINLSISSYGPLIRKDEFKKIFEPFYRGINAVEHTEEGTGFGLYIAQFIARKINTEIFVEQDTKNKFKKDLYTTFSITFNRHQ